MTPPSLRFLAFLFLAGAIWLSCSPQSLAQNPCCVFIAPADTNATVVRSGGVTALQTQTRSIYFAPVPGDYVISFSFGFATDEVPKEGEILDSVTLLIENTNSGVATVLFTADAGGFTWLPYTPSLLSVLPDALESAPTGFPNIQPLPAQRRAYQVRFAVPPTLQVDWANLKLVLYDYPNGLNSVGFLGDVTVIPPPGVLGLNPSNPLQATGPAGGSFAPASQTYTLTNSGGSALTWRATTPATWLTLSPNHGTLALGATATMTVTLNNRARSFGPGTYVAQVAFTNESLETNFLIRSAQLTVVNAPLLAVSPADLFRSLGPPGGAFHPSSRTYTLTNLGGVSLPWQAASPANWLALSPTGGTLPPSTTTNVTVAVNAAAATLGSGLYDTEVYFNNSAGGANPVARPVQLAVASPAVLELMPAEAEDEIRFRLRATPLAAYRIEASTDFNVWIPVYTNTTALDGTYTYAELAPLPYRFFRASFANPSVASVATLELMPAQTVGEFRFRLRATPLTAYRIEASTNFQSWIPVYTNTTAPDGTYPYAESVPLPSRFFRARSVTP
jgi:hypothetical protein